MESAPLNVFQRLTRHWDEIHAYNAAQAIKLAGTADVELLQRTWRSTVEELGLAWLRCDEDRVRWDAMVGATDRHGLTLHTQESSLDDVMTVELNRNFNEMVEAPFRPFVRQESDGHYLGIVYHHWAADSYSIRLLLREWFYRASVPHLARQRPLTVGQRGYWSLFGPGTQNWNLGGTFVQMARWNARFKKARRVEPDGQKDLSTHFTLHRAPDGLIDQVVCAARRHGVTVNDLFLSAIAHVCDQLVPMKRYPWRSELALGTIVDLRSSSKVDLRNVFGLYLGFTSIFINPRELADDRRLLAWVHRQHQLQKSVAAAQASMMRMFAGLVLKRLLGLDSLMEFYRKRLALTAGISNVNLNRDWPAEHHPSPLLEYIRVSPVGPMMPVVFTPTTLGRQLNFGLTCRSSVIPQDHAPALAGHFLKTLQRMCGGSC